MENDLHLPKEGEEKNQNNDSAEVLKHDSGESLDSLQKADMPKKRKKAFVFGLTAVIVVILLVVAGYLVDKYTSINLLGGQEDVTNRQFSAVFLSNGQVYFGTIEKDDDGYTILKNIYYLQVASPLQQVPANGTKAQQPQLVLVKLGNELHGPKDYMKINDRHIIFIEELRPDGQVMQAIKRYKVTGKNSAAQNNNQQPTVKSSNSQSTNNGNSNK